MNNQLQLQYESEDIKNTLQINGGEFQGANPNQNQIVTERQQGTFKNGGYATVQSEQIRNGIPNLNESKPEGIQPPIEQIKAGAKIENALVPPVPVLNYKQLEKLKIDEVEQRIGQERNQIQMLNMLNKNLQDLQHQQQIKIPQQVSQQQENETEENLQVLNSLQMLNNLLNKSQNNIQK